MFVSRIPQIRLKKSVTEILWRGDLVTRRSCDEDLVTEILWQKLPHTLIPIVFVKLCPPRTDSFLARYTSTHTKLSSLPSLVSSSSNTAEAAAAAQQQHSSSHHARATACVPEFQFWMVFVSRIPQITSLPSLVLNLHDFGQLYHFWIHQITKKYDRLASRSSIFRNTEKTYPYVTTAAAQQQHGWHSRSNNESPCARNGVRAGKKRSRKIRHALPP